MSSKPDSKKRKRDDDVSDTVVIFTTSQGKTFRRVLKDQSFDDINNQVKQKLGLTVNEKFTLTELREGLEIELSDDGDFEAFRVHGRSSTELRVIVRVGDNPPAATVSNTDHSQKTSSAATKPKSKPSAATLKYTPLAHPAAATAGQQTVNPVFSTQPIAGPSSRPLVASGSSPAATSSPSLPKKQTAIKTTGPAAKSLESLHTTMAPPPVPSTVAEDLAAKKRRKKTKRPSDTMPSPTPEPSSNVPSAQPTPDKPPGKRKAEATPSGAEPSPEEPAKKKAKKHVTIEDTPEPSAAAKPNAKTKGKSKESADDVSKETGPAGKKKGKGKDAEEKDGKKKKGAKANGKAAMTAEAKQAVMETIRNFSMRGIAPAPQPASPLLTEPTPEAEPDHSTMSRKSKSSKAKTDKASGSAARANSTPTENQTADSPIAPIATEPHRAEKPKSQAKAKSEKALADAAQALAKTLDKAYAMSTEPAPASPEVPKKKASTKKGSRAKETPCPVCLNTPFHFRNQCPVILAGSRSIETRMEELKKQGGHADLVGDLVELLEKARQKETKAAALEASKSTASKSTAKPSPIVLPPITQPVVSEVSTPVSAVIPAGSAISEVAVEGKDDGSSSDSTSSDESEDVEPVAKKNPRIPSLVASATSSVNKSEADVEALLRGPMPRKSILAQIPSTSSSEEGEEEDEEEEASDDEGLASDREEQENRLFRRLSRQLRPKDADDSSDEEPMDDGEEPLAQTKKSDPVELPSSIPRVTNSRPTIVPSSSSESVLKQIVLDDSVEPEDGVAGGSRSSTAPPSVLEEQEEIVPASDQAQSDGEDGPEPSDDHVDKLESDDADIVPSSSIYLAREPSFEVPILLDEPVPEDPVPDEPIPAPAEDSGLKDVDQEDSRSVPNNHAPTPDNLTAGRARSTSSPSEGPQDPIEPAEDLERDIPQPTLDDPIEFDPPINGQQSTPPLTPLKSVLAKRMKDRHGQLDSPRVLPTLASQLLQARASQNEPPASDHVSDQAESAAEQESQDDPAGSRRSSRARKASSNAPITSQTVAPDTSEPQKRTNGRTKLTDEEKARRAAERKAETAARRQAVKEKKQAEREAEKERKAAEKKELAEEKARSKANGVTLRAKRAPRKNVTPEPPESEEENAPGIRLAGQGSSLHTPLPSQPAAPKRIPASMAKWEVLQEPGASPSTPSGDMTMIDELCSSSPALSMNGKRAANGYAEDEDREVPDSQESAPKAQARPSSTLFFPSDTQLPDSQPATQNPFEYSFTTSSQSREKDSSQGMSSKFKKPVQPASTWQKNLLPTPTNLARRASAPFKRLTDIMSSQDVLSFSQSAPTPATNAARRRVLVTAEERKESMYGNLGDDGSESEDETDSDGDSTSHIPKSRRAGQKSRKELFVD